MRKEPWVGSTKNSSSQCRPLLFHSPRSVAGKGEEGRGSAHGEDKAKTPGSCVFECLNGVASTPPGPCSVLVFACVCVCVCVCVCGGHACRLSPEKTKNESARKHGAKGLVHLVIPMSTDRLPFSQNLLPPPPSLPHTHRTFPGTPSPHTPFR